MNTSASTNKNYLHTIYGDGSKSNDKSSTYSMNKNMHDNHATSSNGNHTSHWTYENMLEDLLSVQKVQELHCNQNNIAYDFEEHSSNSLLQNFPRKLMMMIEQEDDDIIKWTDAGEAFFILDTEKITKEVLPKYFRQSKLASFQRQLNLYGFSRINKGKFQGAYQNLFFKRNRKDLLCNVRRLPGKGARASKAAAYNINIGNNGSNDNKNNKNIKDYNDIIINNKNQTSFNKSTASSISKFTSHDTEVENENDFNRISEKKNMNVNMNKKRSNDGVERSEDFISHKKNCHKNGDEEEDRQKKIELELKNSDNRKSKNDDNDYIKSDCSYPSCIANENNNNKQAINYQNCSPPITSTSPNDVAVTSLIAHMIDSKQKHDEIEGESGQYCSGESQYRHPSFRGHDNNIDFDNIYNYHNHSHNYNISDKYPRSSYKNKYVAEDNEIKQIATDRSNDEILMSGLQLLREAATANINEGENKERNISKFVDNNRNSATSSHPTMSSIKPCTFTEESFNDSGVKLELDDSKKKNQLNHFIVQKIIRENDLILQKRQYGNIKMPICSAESTHVLYGPLELTSIEKFSQTHVLVLDSDPIRTAIALTRRGENVALLNMIQLEEDICRRSDFSKHLDRYSKRWFYIPESGGVYSPDVIFFRDNKENRYNFLPKPVPIDILSVPAFDLSSYDSQGRQRYNLREDSTLCERTKQKIRTILSVGVGHSRPDIEHRNTVLILGEWGCGRFKNDSEVMAKLFFEVLQEYHGLFKFVLFSIEKKQDRDNIFPVFHRILHSVNFPLNATSSYANSTATTPYPECLVVPR